MRQPGQGAGIGRERMIRRERVFEVTDQFGELVRKIMRRILPAVALQRHRGALVAARRAAEPEVDAVGMKPRQQAELFGDLEGRIMR